MKVTADTNVLVRAFTEDEPRSAVAAQRMLSQAELVAIPNAALCEFVWVLRQAYRLDARTIAGAVRGLIGSANVKVDRPAVEFGLEVLDAGGDFADGVIAYEGRDLGGDTFVSFDKTAVRLAKSRGLAARELS